MLETNFNEEFEITKEVKDEIEMQKNVLLKQYKYREEFEFQLSKLSIFFMHLIGCSNWNVRCNFIDDADNDMKYYIADIYIKRSCFKKYKFYYSFEMIDGKINYVFLNEYFRLFYVSDSFNELFSKLSKDHLNCWCPWVLKLRVEMGTKIADKQALKSRRNKK